MNINEQMRLQRWAKDMSDYQNSGLTQSQWCEIRGIKLKTFEKRCKRVRDAAELLMIQETSSKTVAGAIVAVPEHVKNPIKDEGNSEAAIVIHTEKATVEVTNAALPAHLRLVLEVLTYVK